MWDQRYSDSTFVYGKSPNDFVKSNYICLPKGQVLCLADGEGRNGVFLAEKGFAVTSVDMSSVGRDKALKLASERGVSLRYDVANLNDYDYDLGENKWDAIVSIFCHLPVDLRRVLHAKIAQALKPGGCFLLEAYRPEQLTLGTGGPPDKSMMMSEKSLRQELVGLQIDSIQELERDIIEGKLHTGVGAVVQLIATKPK